MGWSKWYLVPENQNDKRILVIKRYLRKDGRTTWQRYPRAEYSSLRGTDLNAFVVRLNGQKKIEAQQREQAYKVDHQYITPVLLEEFYRKLEAEIPNKASVNNLFNWLNKNVLTWFIKQGLPDPVMWKEQEHLWSNALLFKDRSIWQSAPHPGSIKKQIFIANRFLRFRHQKHPKLFPATVLTPISKAQMRFYTASYRQKNPPGKFIPDEHWKIIRETLPDSISPFIQLMYYYGLRRSESLGFDSTTSVKKGYLLVSKQIESYSDGKAKYSVLKDREARNTPHWFTSPKEAYNLITAGMNSKMHPDTLSDKWDALMNNLELPYRTHDLRRTFITNALRHHTLRDVQMSVGHASSVTTEKYAQDDRSLDDETFIPE